jgi:hypothetical protein
MLLALPHYCHQSIPGTVAVTVAVVVIAAAIYRQFFRQLVTENLLD